MLESYKTYTINLQQLFSDAYANINHFECIPCNLIASFHIKNRKRDIDKRVCANPSSYRVNYDVVYLPEGDTSQVMCQGVFNAAV